MKDTGMNRKVDDLGRIVIPAELRKTFGIQEGDKLDISVDENKIILTLQAESCVFCRSSAELKSFRDRLICKSCVEQLVEVPVSRVAQSASGSWDPFAEA